MCLSTLVSPHHSCSQEEVAAQWKLPSPYPTWAAGCAWLPQALINDGHPATWRKNTNFHPSLAAGYASIPQHCPSLLPLPLTAATAW